MTVSTFRVALAGMLLVVTGAAGGQRTLYRSTSLRRGPGAYYPAVRTLEEGTTVGMGSTRGSWHQVDALATNGWVAARAFERPSPGVDYAGLLGAEGVVSVSSVDIAAATKGAFLTAYADRHEANPDIAGALSALAAPPSLVARLAQDLRPPRGPVMVGRLPRPQFTNNIVLSLDAEHVLGQALVSSLAPKGFIDDPELVAYVNAVAALVGAHTERYDLAYRVGIVEDDSINGFGMPGGYIVITRGYLDRIRDEAELACILGHEMAHSSLYHGLREFQKRDIHRRRDAMFAELDAISGDDSMDAIEDDLNRLADVATLKIMGERAREDELAADLHGAAYAAAAGYDPYALIDLLSRTGEEAGHDMFRHHPPLADRLAALKDGIRRYRLVSRGQVRMAARYHTMLKHGSTP